MKIKIKKVEKGIWDMAIHRGNGGISSLIIGSRGKFWHTIRVFSPKYIWRALTW